VLTHDVGLTQGPVSGALHDKNQYDLSSALTHFSLPWFKVQVGITTEIKALLPHIP